MNLRPAQLDILQYRQGRMAVSAVPGSGKTFTLSLLAAQLIADERVTSAAGQQVLIVTYLNSSVETFRARIRQRLEEMGQPLLGFDVRTLHSLALEIVRAAFSGSSEENELPVADEAQTNNLLASAVDGWIEANREIWYAFLPDDSPQMRARWRDITGRTAQAFMRAAKNERHTPQEIQSRLQELRADPGDRDSDYILIWMLAGIYARYQSSLTRQGALDFDDLIWQAASLLQQRLDLVDLLRTQWPYVLEDEAQDSVPLQEVLLGSLTGPYGNWVRVGDPNQAITSTFTSAHPRFFNDFIDRPEVVFKPLPNSGRCAPLIFNAANTLVHWVCDHHPVEEVRRHTFRRQDILPTPPGDAQPNPLDSEAQMRIRVFKHREDEELPAVARQATDYARKKSDHTLAILVPTNDLGHTLAEYLDELDADYDNLLRGGSREREIAAALHAMLAILVNPQDNRALAAAHAALRDLGHPMATVPVEEIDHLNTVLRSIHSPETLFFPADGHTVLDALPAGVVSVPDLHNIEAMASFIRRLFALRTLPVDDLVLALADELFSTTSQQHEADLAVAYQIATIMRQWRDLQPEWRLPELIAQLSDVAAGRRSLPVARPGDLGYEPQPGRITLTTQHSAKGLEWDAVFLIGIDGFWIPGDLDGPFLGVHDFLGGDPAAEANAQLRQLMSGDAGLFPGRTATESAHIEIISERLRLLYVGITRARRYLQISRSRATRRYNTERNAEPATVMGVLYNYLRALESEN